MKRAALATGYKFWILLTLLAVFTLVTRLYALNSIPQNLQPDAVDTLRTFLELKHKGTLSTILLTNWNGAPALNTYLVGWGWLMMQKQFGGVRLAAVIFSTLAITLTYIYIYLLTKKRYLSFAFSLLLSTNPTYLHFSRSGWENIFNSVPLLIGLIGIYYLTQKKQSRKLGFFLVIAASILGMYFYHPGKLFLPLFLIAVVLATKQKLYAKLKTSAYILTLVGLFVFPSVYMNITHQSNMTQRIRNVFIFSPEHIRERQHLNQKIINNTVGFLLFTTDHFYVGLNERYAPLSFERCLITPVIVFLYVVGLIVSFKRHPEVNILYLGNLIFIQLLSSNTPNVARFIHLMPLVYVFAALGLEFGLELVRSASGLSLLLSRITNLPYIKQASVFGGIIFVLALSYKNLITYFTWSTSNTMLQVREPAIWQKEYNQWLKYTQNKVKQTGTSINVYDWKRIADSAK